PTPVIRANTDPRLAKPGTAQKPPTPTTPHHPTQPAQQPPSARQVSFDAIAAAKKKLQEQVGKLPADPLHTHPHPHPPAGPSKHAQRPTQQQQHPRTGPSRPTLSQRSPAPPPQKLDIPSLSPPTGSVSAHTPSSAAASAPRDPRLAHKSRTP